MYFSILLCVQYRVGRLFIQERGNQSNKSSITAHRGTEYRGSFPAVLKALPRGDTSFHCHLQVIGQVKPDGQATLKQQFCRVTLWSPEELALFVWPVAKMTFLLFEFINNLVIELGLEWRIKSFLICKSFKRIK